MKTLVFGVFLVLFITPAYAEFRIWTDQAENVFEAEYVRSMGKNVYLKGRNGKTLKVAASKLSKEDVNYVQLKNPPKLSLDVDLEELEREYDYHFTGTSEARKSETTHVQPFHGVVSVKRNDRQVYEHSLTVHLYWLSSRLLPAAERTDDQRREVVVLAHHQSTFFPDQILRGKTWEWTLLKQISKP